MLEKEMFKKYKFDKNKLVSYGFIMDNNKFVYSTNFFNNGFKCVITIDNDNIEGIVYDLEFNDIYDSFRVENIIGEFVNNVREDYIKILMDIRNKCCISNSFIYDQSNRITKNIYDKYNIRPDFLFDDDSTGVFRNKDSLKWFGIIMNINSSKLTDKFSKDCEVINVKINKDKLDELLKINGIYKAYHMNKKSWISIILDDTLDDDLIMELIDYSYKFNILNNEWVVPVNVNFFNVIDYYDNNENKYIKMKSSMNIGDIVYIYLSSPYSCIMYRGVITDINVDMGYDQLFAKIDILKKYSDSDITFNKMKELGVNSVRGARRITKELSEYINNIG